MNRIALTLDVNGHVASICSDEPVEVFFVSPHTPHDRVYSYGTVEVGPQFVRREIGGYAVGHASDGTLDVSEHVAAKLPPSRPVLSVVAGTDKGAQP